MQRGSDLVVDVECYTRQQHSAQRYHLAGNGVRGAGVHNRIKLSVIDVSVALHTETLN